MRVCVRGLRASREAPASLPAICGQPCRWCQRGGCEFAMFPESQHIQQAIYAHFTVIPIYRKKRKKKRVEKENEPV